MNHPVQSVREPARETPVIYEADLCVVGGSCTGVFAAVRAARLGLRVVIVEGHNCFGGVATNAMVNIWHSLHDTAEKQQIIAGLTEEVIGRLRNRDAVIENPQRPSGAFMLNTEELKIELDEIINEHRIKPFLHTLFVAPYVEDEQLKGVIVENKDGRGVILARAFVDATGDGDLAARLGLDYYTDAQIQPGTTCAKISNLHKIEGLGQLYREHREEYNLPQTFIWNGRIPGKDDVFMLAATRVALNMSSAEQLTAAEMEGRRQVRAILDLANAHRPEAHVTLLQLPSRIGVRETRHIRCEKTMIGEEIMSGERPFDAIANGTYPSDLHHTDKSGITFRYLDGTQRISRPGQETEHSRWRDALDEEPRFYQISYRAMLPRGGRFPNVVVAGRMIDADVMAHAAIRVMVNMNQTGEAAGVAAYLALDSGKGFPDIDAQTLRKTLQDGGSAIV